MIGVFAVLAALQAAGAPQVEMGPIEVRLFYKSTGRLSENILGQKDAFTFHNTPIGGGDAQEYADDLLVSVRLTAGRFGAAADKHRYINSPVEIVAKDANGKVLGRRVHDAVLTSADGTESKVLWLNDVTCAGHVAIFVKFRGEQRTANLVMGCGE